MANLNFYAKKLNEVAISTRERARKVENDYNDAELTARAYPRKYGTAQSDGYLLKSIEAEGKLAKAQTERDAFWRDLPETTAQKIAEIRADLAAALDDVFAADPRKLNAQTLTLLESGIMTPHEYDRLLSEATENGNTTLARLIGAHAEKAAERVLAERGAVEGEQAAAEYRAVAMRAAEAGKVAERYLEAFDVAAEALRRCASNYLLFDQWEALTAPVMSLFEEA